MTQQLDPLAVVNTPPPEEDPRKENQTIPTGMMIEALQKQRLAGNPFSVSSEFVEADQAERGTDLQNKGFLFGVGEDVTQVQAKGGAPRFVETALGGIQRSNVASGGTADLNQFVDQGTANRLGQLGLQGVYEQNEFKGYRYNPNTGQYDYYDNTPSMLEQLAPELVKGVILGAATGGLGGYLSSSTGLALPASKAIASAGLSAFMGDDVDFENVAKNVLMSYGMDKLGSVTEGISTGSEFTDNIVKDSIGSMAKGKDPKEAVLGSILKESGSAIADSLGLGELEDSFLEGLSDFDKEYLQPIKNYVEEALGVDFSEAYDEIKDDVDGFLDKVPDEIKDLIEGYGKFLFGKATGIPTGATGGTGVVGGGSPSGNKADLVTVQLKNPELVEGFDYNSLDNPLMNSRVI